MSKPFKVRMQEILDEIKETSKVKKMKSTFSRKMLTEVTEAMLNDVEYSINTYGLKAFCLENYIQKHSLNQDHML